MPFRIETDPTLRRACGTDGPAWASAYMANQTKFVGDGRHIELAAWFDAAISAGKLAERTTIAEGLNRIDDDYPMRASDIGAFLLHEQFAAFLAIWTSDSPKYAPDETPLEAWEARAARDRGDVDEDDDEGMTDAEVPF